MQPLRLTRAQVRQVDRIAIEEYGIPGIVLMENAARGLADQVNTVHNTTDSHVLIVCGGGNNGGDGYAAARHLDGGQNVTILSLVPTDRLKGDARIMADIAVRCGIRIVDDVSVIESGTWDVIVDAVFGTGLSRPAEGVMREAIEAMARLAGKCPIVAADVPSGFDVDTGKPIGACVRADVTVTFAAWKAGFDAEGAVHYTGHVIVAGIGVPPAVFDRVLTP